MFTWEFSSISLILHEYCVCCRQRTRAEVLLERACVRRQGTSDVLENARLWNVPVWPLAKLVKWLTVLKESGRYKPSRTNGVVASKSSSLSSSPKVTRLRAPFIKTEAFTRLVAFFCSIEHLLPTGNRDVIRKWQNYLPCIDTNKFFQYQLKMITPLIIKWFW